MGKIEGYKCPRCSKNYGYIYMDKFGAMYFCADFNCLKDDKENSISLQRTKTKTNDRDAAREFCIGSNYINASLSKWMVSQFLINSTQDWLKDPQKFLVYQGIPGAGKTYFCAAIANFLFSMKREPRYIHTRDFLSNCKKTFDTPGENPLDYIKNLCSCDILILDDLGCTMNTEYQKEILLYLIDLRYSNNQPTVVTTNLNSQEMILQLGDRIARRIYDESKILTKDIKYAR
jgi:DNA replication protein DnaC